MALRNATVIWVKGQGSRSVCSDIRQDEVSDHAQSLEASQQVREEAWIKQIEGL